MRKQVSFIEAYEHMKAKPRENKAECRGCAYEVDSMGEIIVSATRGETTMTLSAATSCFWFIDTEPREVTVTATVKEGVASWEYGSDGSIARLHKFLYDLGEGAHFTMTLREVPHD